MSEFKVIKSLSGMLQVLNHSNKDPFKKLFEIGEKDFIAFSNHYYPKDIEDFDTKIREREIIPYLMLYNSRRTDTESILYDLYKGFLNSDPLIHMAQSDNKKHEFAVLVCSVEKSRRVYLEGALEYLLRREAFMDLNIQAVFITEHDPEFIGMLLMYTPEVLPVFLIDNRTTLWYNNFQHPTLTTLVAEANKRKALRIRYAKKGGILYVHSN